MKIKKINLTVESIIWVLFIVIFSYAVLVVGSPINTQPRILYVSINILFIITMFCLFIKKQKIKITKIDLLLLIITISTFLPLIFRTSASLQETVNGIIEYICLFELYICFKALAKDNKRKKQIENLLIVLVMVLIIFGIDMMTYNVLEPVYSILDKVKVFQKATDIKRMVSLFEYANTFGILIAIGYILTLKKAFEDKKSIFVNICLVIQLFAILESKSRFTLFLVLIATIMYFISQRKETELKKQILKIFVLGFISIICDTLYSQFIQNTNNNMTFVVLASTIGITILFTLFSPFS